MNWRKKLPSFVIVIFLIMITTGCGTKTLSTDQVNPMNKAEIVNVQIAKGNSYQKEFTDLTIIGEIIDNLNKVMVKKASVAEEKKILDSGNAFTKDSTITINLLTDKGIASPQSTAILLSEKELFMPDIKSSVAMKSSVKSARTVSYISDLDETTLESIKALYSIAEESMK